MEKQMNNDKYLKIFEYVKSILSENDLNATKIEKFPFRIRSSHCWRVFSWTKRLIEDEINNNLNKDAHLLRPFSMTADMQFHRKINLEVK
jgi:hypothetical protein